MDNHPNKPVENTRLKKVNKVLSVAVVAIALYIILAPLWPHFLLWWQNLTDSTEGYHYSSQLSDNKDLPAPPDYNALLIPKIQVDEKLVDGPSSGVLAEGVWRRPQTSTPDKGSNTVFVAHRFTYSAPASFYHLDKLNVGDQFAVFWEGQEYDYEVFETLIVPPTAIEIEDPSSEPMVTLYTCTPIWTAKNRLIVKAKLVDTTNEALKPEADQ